MGQIEVKQMLANIQDERESAFLYQSLAKAEKDAKLAEVYQRMAAVELRHADSWTQKLKETGTSLPSYQPSWRARTLAWAARRFGAGAVLPTLIAAEKDGSAGYSQHPETASMAAEENSHARLLNMVSRSFKGGVEGSTLAQIEGRHRAAGGNALRAAVLGANDGLLSNLSLVMGVSGAALSSKAILVTGFAGLLAGASSMALGEWLSVQSSRELYQHQINIEKSEIATAPAEEAEELTLIYQARGLSEEQAKNLATQLLSDPDNALETLAREELAVDPAELGGSAWEAALTSFFLFSIGAIIPVFPHIFFSGIYATIGSILFSLVGLFVIGAAITLFTGRSVIATGLRQIVFGLSAAGITYVVGRLFGVAIGG